MRVCVINIFCVYLVENEFLVERSSKRQSCVASSSESSASSAQVTFNFAGATFNFEGSSKLSISSGVDRDRDCSSETVSSAVVVKESSL